MRNQLKSSKIACVILGTFPVFAGIEFIFPDIWIVHTLLLALLGYGWCKAQVQQRGTTEPVGSAVLVGVLGFLGVFIYFFRSRSLADALRSCLLFIGFMGLCVLLYVLTFWLFDVFYSPA